MTVTAAATHQREADSFLPLPRILVAIIGIYLVQSLIGGFTFQGIPAALRASGASLEVVGMFSLIMVPWALKFLWAPAIERYRLPHGAPRRSRQVVAVTQGIAAACFVAIAFAGPQSAWVLLALLLGLAAASATADIACDGFAIQQLTPENRGWGNTAQVSGGYLGMVVGGGLFLVVLGWYGWTAACLSMCALLVLFTLPFLFTREAKPGVDASSDGEKAHVPNLRFAFIRREVQIGLVTAILFEVGVRLVQSMSGVFLLDKGFDLVTLGFLRGSGAIISGVAGTLLAGLTVRLWGSNRAVIAAIVFQTVMLLAQLAVSLDAAAPHWLLGTVFVAKSVAMAFGFVALYSLLMGYSSQKQAGVDFTLFQCADALIAALAGSAGGFIAQRYGYAVCFGIAAGLGLAACVAMPALVRLGAAASGRSA